MQLVNFVLAASPILIVLIGIMTFKKPAMKVAPVALLVTIILAFTYFNTEDASVSENTDMVLSLLWKGVVEGGKIVAMIFGAFVTLNTLKATGAMEDVKNTVSRISHDRRVQIVIVGMMVPIFLEGAAGAGAPAAIAAPFLVALGFNPITSIAVALLGDATPCSWGGAGLTTISGGDALVSAGLSTTMLNSAMVGRIHMFGVLIIPFIIIWLAFGRKGFKGIVPYLFYAGFTTGLVMFLLSNYVGPEVTSMGTGLISILLSVGYVKVFKIKTPEEYKYEFPENMVSKYKPLVAMSPYFYMLVLLPLVRYTVPLSILTAYGYITWVDCVIFICAMLGAATLRVTPKEFLKTCGTTIKGVMPVLVTMGSLLVVAYVMQQPSTGMIKLLASDLADAAGNLYPAASVFIGSLGSFITGTGLGSNIMFAPMHINAASSLSVNPVTVFAGQNAGASLGNLICPNNTVAACATVGEVGNENKVMRKTFVAFGIIVLEYMVLTMIYTFVLFPNFGI